MSTGVDRLANMEKSKTGADRKMSTVVDIVDLPLKVELCVSDRIMSTDVDITQYSFRTKWV